MKFSKELERDALATIEPVAHLILGPPATKPGEGWYVRADGALPISREGLQEFVHRYFYRKLIKPDLGRRQLTRTCDRWGCCNPYHFRLALELTPGSHTHCPNGHEYEGNTTPGGHCAICAAARRERRLTHSGLNAAAINASKMHCPAGHAYDTQNTYVYFRGGGEHRKCRRCNAQRAALRRTRGSWTSHSVRQ